ncbi:hypothetical protein HU160_02915 [Metamycoplasma hominis]|uniref:hypothetical protein n=1 Tax=Metamycoplasma hominis TaxID=2098 RepID=UPI00158A591A|nr:hypothetical protein [Metamycoplasma hominis]QKX40780.1 hypothetical protein HU160_02915 [Metamycoplasma hominis]
MFSKKTSDFYWLFFSTSSNSANDFLTALYLDSKTLRVSPVYLTFGNTLLAIYPLFQIFLLLETVFNIEEKITLFLFFCVFKQQKND